MKAEFHVANVVEGIRNIKGINGKYDVILALRMFHQIGVLYGDLSMTNEEKRKLLADIMESTKEGGLNILSLFTRIPDEEQKNMVEMVFEQGMKEEYKKAGWKIVKFSEDPKENSQLIIAKKPV